MGRGISLNSELVTWACERSGLGRGALLRRFPALPQWQSGERLPRLAQLTNLAKATRTPLGALFLAEPPVDRLPMADFRLATWFQRELEVSMQKTKDSATVKSCTEIVQWVAAQPQYLDAARNEFQSIADGWLVAFAKAHGWVVVTLEEHNPVKRNKVPIPTLCLALGFECIDPFELLRRLRVRLDWLGQPDNTTQLSLEFSSE
jgi:hypothetical protein